MYNGTLTHGHQGRPLGNSGLWGHLLRKNHLSQAPPSSSTSSTTLGNSMPSITPLDKAGASTRILLHDTQANLEKFTERVTHLTGGVDDAKRELIAVQRLYQDDHEQLTERMISLANRCQTELQKAIGTPAQSSELCAVSKDMNDLGRRLEALDKRIDALSTMNQTQTQALQTIQAQQGQILSALLPVLPLLQAVPVHIDNARNHVKDSVLELRHQLSSTLQTRNLSSLPKRAHSRSSVPASSDPATSPSERKKRRLDEAMPCVPPPPTSAQSRNTPIVARASVTRTHSKLVTPSPASPDVPLSAIVPRLSEKSTPRLPLAELFPTGQSSGTPATFGGGKPPSSSITSARRPRPSAYPRSGVTASIATRSPSRAFYASISSPAGHNPLISASKHDSPQIGNPSITRRPTQEAHPSLVFATPVRASSRASRCSVTPRRPTAQDTGVELAVERPRTPHFAPNADMRPPSVPPSVGKPMSLKDRRALLLDGITHKEEKRFIPLDDEDEDDVELLE